MNEPSKIQKYNNFVHQAATNERQKDWQYAAKLWQSAMGVASSMFWKDKIAYCTNRMAFCNRMAERASK